MAKNQNKIRNLRALRQEIEKTRVGLEYTQEDLEESFGMLKEKVAPSHITGIVNQIIPVLGQALPVGKLLWNVVPQFKSGSSGEKAQEDEVDEAREADNEVGFFGRLVKGTKKVLIPFSAGTLAAGSFWLTRKFRKQ